MGLRRCRVRRDHRGATKRSPTPTPRVNPPPLRRSSPSLYPSAGPSCRPRCRRSSWRCTASPPAPRSFCRGPAGTRGASAFLARGRVGPHFLPPPGLGAAVSRRFKLQPPATSWPAGRSAPAPAGLAFNPSLRPLGRRERPRPAVLAAPPARGRLEAGAASILPPWKEGRFFPPPLPFGFTKPPRSSCGPSARLSPGPVCRGSGAERSAASPGQRGSFPSPPKTCSGTSKGVPGGALAPAVAETRLGGRKGLEATSQSRRYPGQLRLGCRQPGNSSAGRSAQPPTQEQLDGCREGGRQRPGLLGSLPKKDPCQGASLSWTTIPIVSSQDSGWGLERVAFGEMGSY